MVLMFVFEILRVVTGQRWRIVFFLAEREQSAGEVMARLTASSAFAHLPAQSF
jgi:hypothetical protein